MAGRGEEGELDSYIPIQRGLESGPLCGLWFSLGLSDQATHRRVGIPCNDDADSGIDQASTLSKEKEEGSRSSGLL